MLDTNPIFWYNENMGVWPTYFWVSGMGFFDPKNMCKGVDSSMIVWKYISAKGCRIKSGIGTRNKTRNNKNKNKF